MAEEDFDIDYAVLVTERNGVFELRIRELLLVVRGPVLHKAYEELMRRKQEIIDFGPRLRDVGRSPSS